MIVHVVHAVPILPVPTTRSTTRDAPEEYDKHHALGEAVCEIDEHDPEQTGAMVRRHAGEEGNESRGSEVSGIEMFGSVDVFCMDRPETFLFGRSPNVLWINTPARGVFQGNDEESFRIVGYVDVGNMILFGYAQDWLRTVGGRIVRIHLKDSKRRGYQ